MSYTFAAELWESTSGGWVFLSVPPEHADHIDETVSEKRGFGSVRVEVRIGKSTWKTSLFPDKSRATYILPVKKSVRDGEQISIGDAVDVEMSVLETEIV